MTRSPLFALALVALLTALLTGCIHLPSIYSAPPAASQVPYAAPSAPASAVSAATRAVTSLALPVAAPVHGKPASPARKAIQHAINWGTVLLVIGGLVALGFGAFAMYGGQWLAGIKLVLGGFLIIIFAIWFAFHWVLVAGLSLIGAAIYLLVTHWTQVAPVLKKIDADILPFLSRLESSIDGGVAAILDHKSAAAPLQIHQPLHNGQTQAAPVAPAK